MYLYNMSLEFSIPKLGVQVHYYNIINYYVALLDGKSFHRTILKTNFNSTMVDLYHRNFRDNRLRLLSGVLISNLFYYNFFISLVKKLGGYLGPSF